ncbi:MAG TPA: HDIG domain-containing protein [Candidatus Baltobacteraceae bacterium]|nr:HDIG domain-containing protein [Candidatus Baltobacteraceae bacterium]
MKPTKEPPPTPGPNVDLRFSEILPEADRPSAPPVKGWRPLAPLRGVIVRLAGRRWFMSAAAVFFLTAVSEILCSGSPLPLGGWSVLGMCLLVFLLSGALYLYLRYLQSKEIRRPGSLLLIGTVLLIVLVLTRAGLVVLTSFTQSFPTLPVSAMRAALPVPLGGVLLTVLFNPRLAFAGALCLTILSGLMAGAPPNFFLLAFVGSLAGIFAVARRQERTAFFRAGAAIAVASAYTLLAFGLLDGNLMAIRADIVGSLVNGLIVAVLATGLLPLLEQPFGRTTDFTLLELSNLNEPMLRYLILAAPGTYHHSLLVGTLAEAASEAIGANALLSRVGAYYHDIGKTRHPNYFIENNPDAGIRHEKLSPNLSRAMVMSHIKEGLEMGRAYGIPEVLLDMIPQHHGTRLVSFFYQRARESADPDLQEVKEEDYRYPGPKPQSREAAILMLADAVQAASQTLTDPTPARIRGAVQKIINSIFVDGQLDECDLTLRDLHIIANSFVRILTGMFHHRIEYPESAPDDGRKRNENGHQHPKPAGENSRRDSVAKKAGGRDPAGLETSDG